MSSTLPTIRNISQTALAHSEVYASELSYEENYKNGPQFKGIIPKLRRTDCLTTSSPNFLGFSLENPLGISAGPLLNAQWVKFYLDFGFAVPVYKTVRSVSWDCFPPPNYTYITIPEGKKELILLPSQPLPKLLSGHPPADTSQLSIGNSFGVPSMSPKIWMPDVELANSYCRQDQLLIVSIMGTEGADGRNLIDDFGYTAAMAREAGARIIEANLSCPNLKDKTHSKSKAAILYSDPESIKSIAQSIRQSIGTTIPLLLKVGYQSSEQLENLLDATRPYVDGYTGINTLRANVYQSAGQPALPGRLKIGICGKAIQKAARQFVCDLVHLRQKRKEDFAIVGVGGMMEAHDLEERLQDGANLVMSATAAIWDPYLAMRWLNLHQK